MTNHFLLTTLAAASTLLAGCSLIPTYERPAALVAPHYAGAADAAAAKPSETATAVALQWSRYFTDAQLQELIGIALANNRDLRVAALNLDKAQAQFQIQRSALAPQLAAQGNATRGNNQSTGELGNTFIAGITVPAWELDFFGRIRSLKSAALAQYFATDEARQAYELALVASVAQGWLTLLADEELLELSSRTLATRQESMRLTQLRFDTGISSELDLRQAQSLVEAARVTTAQQKRQRAEHENALVLLLGQELPASARSALQTTRLATIAPMVDIPAGLPSDLLTHRPDIRQAEQQLLSANANIGAARAAFFPSISLTGQYGNRSDVGAVAVLSLNDGPFFTLMALGMLGANFPIIAFIAVLLPIAIGMLLGNLDPDIRTFLKPGETLPIPFFAFALGAGMNFATFFNPKVVVAGVTLGLMTVTLTALTGILVFKLFREKSQIAPVAEASTAGNAVGTPAAIAAAASVAAGAGMMSPAEAQAYKNLVEIATLQVSLSTLTTAILCPFAVIMMDKWQKSRGIDAKAD